MKKLIRSTALAALAAFAFAVSPSLHRDAGSLPTISVSVQKAEAAGGKAATASNGMLNHVFRTTSYTAPTNTYFGLMSVCPTTGNTGTELSGNGYTRSSGIAKGDSSWTYTASTFIAASTITNAAAISFPAASGSSWSVACFGVYDASSAGNLLYFGPVTGAPVTVSVGATASFAIGQATLTEARNGSPVDLVGSERLASNAARSHRDAILPSNEPMRQFLRAQAAA